MGFSFPNTAQEFIFLTIPLLTLLLGLAFLFVPGRLFRFMGLEPAEGKPEAIGESRSSFAGPMIAIALICLFLQEPIAMQPGLNLALAIAWTVGVLGRVMQMVMDSGAKRKRVQARAIIAAGIALTAWSIIEQDYFNCLPPELGECGFPTSWAEWFMNILAAFTLLLGLIALFAPKTALSILQLRVNHRTPFAVGEMRATLAGFYIGPGLVFLISPQPVLFIGLALALAWLLTGIGRILSILVDRGMTQYNVIAALFELALGAIGTYAIVTNAL